MSDAVDRRGGPDGAAARRAAHLAAIASRSLVAALVAALVVTVIHAAFLADALAQTTAAPATASPVFGMVQGLLGLAVVVAAIFAAGWMMRKIGPRGRATGIVHVVGGASVGPREKVVVVRFGDRTLLLGVAPGQVSLLHATDEPVDGAAATEGAAATPAAPRFVDRLRAARSGS